jgi:hypothetical protein
MNGAGVHIHPAIIPCLEQNTLGILNPLQREDEPG